jgi:amino acid permease
MPYAIQQGGWIILFFLILSAIMNIYANIKLIECLYHNNDNNRSRRASMTQIADNAFGKIGSGLTSFLFNSLIIGIPILYLILSGENFQTLFNDNFGINLGVKTWILICAIMMCVPFVLFKTIREVSWLG